MIDAFKEWAVVVDALGQGKQIIIIRKGGISEGTGGFKMEHNRFLLFPTLFHQQRESVIPSAQNQFDTLAMENISPETITLDFSAEVVQTVQLRTMQAAKALEGQHIWREDVIEKRFEWGGERAIHALAVRVFKLDKAITLPALPEYGGCKSWVKLAANVPTQFATPVLNDADFGIKIKAFENALKPFA
jgi:hypothetical protein